ncbi:hypothetical protein P154DRAFT_70489 [Amniculicola lignicola CBS 123094]|uniref:BTB domain-containing protein n=1 Tax=Amniculicola lignicola CBS 123094 TaxID=1392246 RepID=A0A6A5VVU1_9PLEO|nr:hypothetical protein P154DRAFT_70489 [Amniculicola lignicola CBS 123094]
MASSNPACTKTLLNDKTFSDVKIRQIKDGEVKEYNAQKAILCSHFKWFLKALTVNFKEASESVIKVHDDGPAHFKVMLEFFYMDGFAFPAKVSTRGSMTDTIFDKHFMIPIGFNALADKYELFHLTTHVAVYLEQALEEFGARISNQQISEMVDRYYEQCHRMQMAVVFNYY